ncbi:BnaC03g47650D [Brassica napus]|uniref:BnaC03g47650D protein n=1 Tax=Brassica napus TaxID=3708 RepID=A0A078F448_BRANA|nr:BnaC03g47650D [Brassica napus]
MTDRADPYYAEMKQHKRDADWLFPCMYANYCIPKKCACGGAITVETDERGRNYYVCKVFEDDGLHIRRACHDAI